MRRQLLVLALLVAACSNDQSASSNDAGLDAPTLGPTPSDAGAGGTDAATDASAAGCQPCVVGKSTVGNCCLQ